MTHAPSPWLNVEGHIESIDHGKKYIVAIVQNEAFTLDSNKANALLIAAAPELLKALKNALNVLAGIATGDLPTITRDSAAIKQAREAITKAEKRI